MDRQSFEALLSAGEFEAPERPTALDTITATDLQKKDLPPIRFIVDRLLSVGLNILASPPKYGKSWMVLASALRWPLETGSWGTQQINAGACI